MGKWMKILSLPLLSILVWGLPLGGAFSSDANIGSLILRAMAGETEQQIAELEFYACLEEAGSTIPNGEKTSVIVSGDFGQDGVGYLEQRLDEILYPRIRIVESEADFEYLVSPIELSTPESISKIAQSRSVAGLYQCAYALIVTKRVG